LDEPEKPNHPDDGMDRIDPVASAIMAIPATTWAGALVKAQLAKFAADGFLGPERGGYRLEQADGA
jgi:hypothetical protein